MLHPASNARFVGRNCRCGPDAGHCRRNRLRANLQRQGPDRLGGHVRHLAHQNTAIVGGSLKTALPQNEFLCTTREYADFELRLKFKLLGKTANGGVQIRSRRVPKSHEVSGYQADLGIAWDRPAWGNLYDESRRNKNVAQADQAELSKVFKPGDWNDYRIRCQGRRIQLWINGYQTVDYTEPDKKIAQTGIIGLQIHGGPPSEAWYKDIIITPLPPR